MSEPTADSAGAKSIQRFSSRRERLDHSFLTKRLTGAKSYDRIAGYFCGSILETAGEALESVTGPIRVICNSGLREADVVTARAAAAAIRQEWCASKPEARVEEGGTAAKERLSRLYAFLHSGKLQVKVLPDKHFGLVHGKAGVITLADGSKSSFMGSANETYSGWRLNYEMVWEDPSPDAVAWVQEEFDALWGHHAAVPLAEFVMDDVKRLSEREIIGIKQWRQTKDEPTTAPAAVFIETPVYRKQVGLWEHQKYFVKLAFDAHLQNPGGARFVLADQVGLGKTVQLAMAAELMALAGDKPVLILAPKTLLWQWQDELMELLDLPSAVWNGRQWVDENEIEYPAAGPEGIRRCPRRIGLVSQGLVQRLHSAVGEHLKGMSYECVIVDESHRARRRNLGPGCEGERADPNNLLQFLYDISSKTKSMLLATATPVQIKPVEAWDLLDALSRGSEGVLGGPWSKWRRADEALDMVMGQVDLPTDDLDMWQWLRSPFPPSGEHSDFAVLRRAIGLPDSKDSATGGDWDHLRSPDRARVKRLFPRLVSQHNPFIRHIVRRSRKYLEETIDPETNEPFLKPIRVELFGEGDDEAVQLPLYLRDAYEVAEDFSRLLAGRVKGAGFLKTLLLRRVGSSIAAGRITAEKMLASWRSVMETDEDDEDVGDENGVVPLSGESKTLTDPERDLLMRFFAALDANAERDPKYAVVLDCLQRKQWLARGCIIFSQYFDSVNWLAQQLTADFKGEPVAVYAGSGRSGIWLAGDFKSVSRDEIKAKVRSRDLRLLIGTDAASEGLNLQRLGTLINLDLPWNPTRLEQRKGRIQRIGQLNDVVYVYNMRYRGSVEDRVHQLLSSRLEDIHTMFGQVPDVLEDVWIEVAMGETERAKKKIAGVPTKHPFDIRYQRIEKTDWERCERVLSSIEKKSALRRPW